MGALFNPLGVFYGHTHGKPSLRKDLRIANASSLWLVTEGGYGKVLDLGYKGVHGSLISAPIKAVAKNSQYGRWLDFTTGDDCVDGGTVSRTSVDTSSGKFTVAFVGRVVNSGTVNYGTMICKRDGATCEFQFYWDSDASRSIAFRTNGVFDSSSGIQMGTVAANGGRWYIVIASVDTSKAAGSQVKFTRRWLDTRTIDTAAIGSGTNYSAPTRQDVNLSIFARFNGYPARSFDLEGGFLYSGIWDFPFTDAEMEALALDPFQIFTPGGDEFIPVALSSGGGASVSVPAGSLSLTAFAPSVQISGNQAVNVPAASLTLTAFAPTVTAAVTGFDADFERANLNTSSSSITNPASSTPSVTIVPRVQTVGGVTKHWYYFFKLTNVNGKTPTFSISETNYYLGSGGYPNPVFSYDRSTWTEFDNHADGGTTWTFSHNTAFTSDTVYICYHYPFGMTELDAWITASLSGATHVSEPPSSSGNSFVANQTISQTTDDSRTVPAQNIYSLKITDSGSEPDDGYGKRTCVLFAGTHAGEDIGNYQLQGAVEYLLGGSAVANRLLKNFQFFIYPMVNPAGRYGGNFRGSWESGAETEDPNRNIATGVLDHMTKVKNAVDTDTGGVCHVFCDWHGWHGVGNYGYYGANTTYVDAFVAAIETYTGGLTDHGTDADTWNSGYHRTNLGTEYSFTPESHHDNMDSLAEMKAYGEATMKAMDDLFTANTFDFVDIAVPAASLTLTANAPSVAVTGPQTVNVPAGSLTLTANAPTVTAGGSVSVSIPLGTLSLTGQIPTVTATDGQAVSVPLGTLTLAANAPTVTAGAAATVSVPAGVITLTGYAPTVTGSLWTSITKATTVWSEVN